MSAVFAEGQGPQTIGELTRMVEENAMSAIAALGVAYALGFEDGKAQTADDQSARVVRVGEEGNHTPEVKT